MWGSLGRGMCTGKGPMVKAPGTPWEKYEELGLAGVHSLRGKASQEAELTDSIYITQALRAGTESSRSHVQTLASWTLENHLLSRQKQ